MKQKKEISKKHYVFDLDDTLTDSYDYNQQMFVNTFIPYLDIQINETETYLRELHQNSRGTSMISQFQKVIDRYSLNLSAEELVKVNENLHLESLQEIRVFEAVSDFIKKLKDKGKKISLFSNRNGGSLRKFLNFNKITDYFDNVVSCGDEGHEKPDPYCFLELIKKEEADKSDFIFFGDSKTDYEFATSAGVDCIIIDHYINQKKFYKMMLETFIN